MIGTLDIPPVHRACLTLHEILFPEKCNHGLEYCFLLSKSENDKLVRGGRIFQMSVSLQGYFAHELNLCSVSIEVLLKIVMILHSHQKGFVRDHAAYNLSSG